MHFPLFVDIKCKNVLVVGGGNIASRRVKTLLGFECNIIIVSPSSSDYILELANSGRVTLIERNFLEDDLQGVFLATATTDNREVNFNVGRLAREIGIFVSVADSKEESNFYFPAIANHDECIIAIGSNGENHKRVSRLAQAIRSQSTRMKSLEGVKILVTSPNNSKSEIVGKLIELGAEVEHTPVIDIVEVEFVPPSLEEFTWIVFTSSAGVNIFFSRYSSIGIDARGFAGVKFAVVGSKTAKTLQSYGITADFIPTKFDADNLLQELARTLTTEDKLLLIRPETNSEALREILVEHQVEFTELSIYRTEHITTTSINLESFDYVTFTSSSCVESLCKVVDSNRIQCGVCIGEKTANTARNYNINTITAKISTINSLIESVVENVENKRSNENAR